MRISLRILNKNIMDTFKILTVENKALKMEISHEFKYEISS